MSNSRAVIRIDHREAHLLHLEGDGWRAQTITTRTQPHPHGSDVRTDHEYFAQICGALTGIGEVLVTGPHTAQSDFRRYVKGHRARLEDQLVGWETVDHPTDGQLVALARKYFEQRDRTGAKGSATSSRPAAP